MENVSFYILSGYNFKQCCWRSKQLEATTLRILSQRAQLSLSLKCQQNKLLSHGQKIKVIIVKHIMKYISILIISYAF